MIVIPLADRPKYSDYTLAVHDLCQALHRGDLELACEAYVRPCVDMDWYSSLKDWAEEAAPEEEMRDYLDWYIPAWENNLKVDIENDQLNWE